MGNLTYTTTEVQEKLDAVTSTYFFVEDPTSGFKLRMGVRNDEFKVDVELTVTGFAGVEGTDWENIFGAS